MSVKHCHLCKLQVCQTRRRYKLFKKYGGAPLCSKHFEKFKKELFIYLKKTGTLRELIG